MDPGNTTRPPLWSTAADPDGTRTKIVGGEFSIKT